MKTINTRSKVSIYYTTNPANLGYDGKKTEWKTGTPAKVTSPVKALNFRNELNQLVGQGVYRSIAYFVGGVQVDLESLQDVANEVEYRKYANR